MSDFVRRYERMETHIVLSYKSIQEEIFNSSQLLDISRSGMQFTTSKAYPQKIKMQIHVLVPTSYPNKLKINGIIAHSREKMKDILYHTGVEFTDNTREIDKEINKYLDYLGADKNISTGVDGSSAEDIHKENRRYRRLKSQVIIQYIELGSESIKSSQIVDISEGGLLFNSDSNIPLGHQIRMKMTVPTSFPHPIKLEGTACHSNEVMKGSLYQIGIQFSKEFPEPLEAIKKYIRLLESRQENPDAFL